MASRFVRPDTKTLSISGGDTLTVKKRLNHGETTAAYERMSRVTPNGSLKVDPLKMGSANILAYLVDWSLKDDDGQLVEIKGAPVDVVSDALDSLDEPSFQEIKAAVEAHAIAMEGERVAEKNGQDGAIVDAAISPLPSGVTGASSGSVN